MSNILYKKTEEFVNNSLGNKNKKPSFKHLIRTVYWIKKLKPDADEALLIAAVSHDIERAFRGSKGLNKIQKGNYFLNKNILKHHQEKGAKIISDFLKRQGADKKLIKKVKTLVEKHEVGGNEDQNILKDADSISFFENNVDFFIKVKVKQTSKDEVKEKFNFMYNRISSAKAKQLALKFFNEAICKLNKY